MLEHASGPYPAIEVTPETPVFSGTYRSKSNGPTNTGAVEHRRVSSLVEEAPTSPDLSSDSFQTSSLSESEQIVHVYALLERLGGVFGDGLLEGVELTRDGRALSYQSSNTGKAQWNKRLHQARFGDAQTQHTISTLTQGPETDRYGFFTRQHSLRSSTSSNDARTWLLERVSYATDTATPGASAIPKRASLVSTRPPNREEVAKEIERTDKWLKMLRHSGSPGQEQVWSFSPKILSSSREQRKVWRSL